MGRYDDIEPEDLRRNLVRVARLILRLDASGSLLREAPRMQKLLGDLRQRLFAYEVRHTADLESGGSAEEEGGEGLDPGLRESLRIVEEARTREEELREELERGTPPENSEDEDEP